MFSAYTQILRDLWQYHEFQILYLGLRYALLVIVLGLLIIMLLHVSYLLGFNSPLYSRRSPKQKWNKRFFPAMAIIIICIYALYVLTGSWIKDLN
jgi:hypothetical protein